ncbi:(-)-germacrene D synthase-like [Iris pallida]|uniref:(-)-germacrene D synthase-like n=1 Tax=Iris pallida TaxID=29817 RepID=A0AAX6H0D3_IRIPA|nr:(-)-germacrene D synthase-like [Iris pallida]
MEEVLSKDTLDWLLTVPKIVKACSILGRLMDDMASSEFEQQRMHLDSSLQICMREEGITKQEAVAKLNKMVENRWKDINKECLNPLPSRKHLNLVVLNFTRVMEVVYYQHKDSYPSPEG